MPWRFLCWRRSQLSLVVACVLVLGNFRLLQLRMLTVNTTASARTTTENGRGVIGIAPSDESLTFPADVRSQTGYWIADRWYPPGGWKFFRLAELQQLYQGKRIYWIGDDEESAKTMFVLLNHSHPTSSVSYYDFRFWPTKGFDCSKWPNSPYRPHFCRSFPSMNHHDNNSTAAAGEFSARQEVCYVPIERFLRDELQNRSNILVSSKIDLLIISLGIWEIHRPQVCSDKKQNRTMAQVLGEVLRLLNELSNTLQITTVWRTSGFVGSGDGADQIREMNALVMDTIDHYSASVQNTTTSSYLSYVNWGGAVEPRSLLFNRISGVTLFGYGVEPRIVLVQMITNSLDDQGFFAGGGD